MVESELALPTTREIVVDRSGYQNVPVAETIQGWVSSASVQCDGDIFVNFVSMDQSRQLNRQFRNINEPTNVLSFPAELPSVLGDVAICADIAAKEAESQNKRFEEHLAHLVIHGVLHLCGYDHVKDEDAEVMESKEVALLKSIGMPNPYE